MLGSSQLWRRRHLFKLTLDKVTFPKQHFKLQQLKAVSLQLWGQAGPCLIVQCPGYKLQLYMVALHLIQLVNQIVVLRTVMEDKYVVNVACCYPTNVFKARNIVVMFSWKCILDLSELCQSSSSTSSHYHEDLGGTLICGWTFRTSRQSLHIRPHPDSL